MFGNHQSGNCTDMRPKGEILNPIGLVDQSTAARKGWCLSDKSKWLQLIWERARLGEPHSGRRRSALPFRSEPAIRSVRGE